MPFVKTVGNCKRCTHNRQSRQSIQYRMTYETICQTTLLLCPAPRVGAVSNDACLTSVCLSRTSGQSRKPRGLGRLRLAQRQATSTCDSDTIFKVKMSKINLQGSGAYCGGLQRSLLARCTVQQLDSYKLCGLQWGRQNIPPLLMTITATQNFQVGGHRPCRLMMQVIVLHPYTKFEVRRPSRFEDMADFRSRR